MPREKGHWSSQHLSEFLAGVTAFQDEHSAFQAAVRWAGEALGAEIGMIVDRGHVIASAGLAEEDARGAAINDAHRGGRSVVTLPDIGVCGLIYAGLEEGLDTHLVLARSGPVGFSRDEAALLGNMARSLCLVVKMLRTLEAERAASALLLERQQLFERLSKIQRSISHRAPLQEVLDAITEGTRALIRGDTVGLRFIDPNDRGFLYLASSHGVDEPMLEQIRRGPIREGAGGRAVTEGRLVIIENYTTATNTVGQLAEQGLQSAMAAPVYQEGEIVGSLVTASYEVGRTYSESEKEVLLAMAAYASIAVTDAKTVAAMKEARQAKEMFLAMVSHELKTPLTVMMGALHTVERRGDAIDKKLRDELLHSALKRGHDLQRLIEMLLKGARAELAEAGRNVRLSDLIGSALKGFDAVRPITIETHSDLSIFVDDAAVAQILGVFLDNAIAHSPEGTPITVTSWIEENRVSISVRNEGRFAPGTDLEELFKPFHRGSDATSSGVGLGLYIARQLAEALEGRVDVESEEDVSFVLSFPVVAPAASEAIEETDQVALYT
jgi:signal transduction histidine kinase